MTGLCKQQRPRPGGWYQGDSEEAPGPKGRTGPKDQKEPAYSY